MKNKLTTLAIITSIFLSIQAIPFFNQNVLDLGTLFNYSNPAVPNYMYAEATFSKPLSDEVSTLGRVLFYDNQLSLNSSISCASCHKQEFAFGDTLVASPGFDKKLTERHSTRLVNLNLNHMPEVFWDRRAGELDSLPVMVLTNAIEMGFSGENGQPKIDSLISRLKDVPYYKPLLTKAFGDAYITEERVNLALTEFVRSIVSFDSKYDVGRNQVYDAKMPFPNFTESENRGKKLFLSEFPEDVDGMSVGNANNMLFGRMGCADCHGIDNFTTRKTSLTGHNGIVGVIGHPDEKDTTVKRSPSLRNLFNPNGIEIGPYMHDGSLQTLEEVMDHYSKIGLSRQTQPEGLHSSLHAGVPRASGGYTGPVTGNQGPQGAQGAQGPQGPTTLNPRLRDNDIEDLIAFMKTLSGTDIFTNEKWSNPFDENDQITITDVCQNAPVTEEEISICEGDDYHGFLHPGQYKRFIKRQNKCDSIVITNLKIKPLIERVINTTVCPEEDVYGLKQPGFYSVKVASDTGCDSVLYITLKHEDAPVKYSRIWICEGDNYKGYTEVGTHYDTIPSNEGCDTLEIIRLRKTSAYSNFIGNIFICKGESFRGYTEEDKYRDTLQARVGCDSIVSFNLYHYPENEIFLEETICENETYLGYSASGEYIDVFTNEYGCDSTRYLNLKVNPKSHSIIEKELCFGEFFEGYNASGTYVDIFRNSNGCDSIRELNLIVHTEHNHSFDVEICEGETYMGYNESGQYKDIFTNMQGCDSTRYLNLKVLSHSESYYDISICKGEAFEGYDQSGFYEDMLVNAVGCDSLRAINLEILYPSESLEVVDVCPGYDFEGYTEGLYEEYYINEVGCDSTRYIEVRTIDAEDVICTPSHDVEKKLMDATDFIKFGPNPVLHQLNFSIDRNERLPGLLTIYSSNHIKVKEINIIDPQTIIDCSDLGAGAYILHFQNDLNQFVGRLVKI